MGQASAILHSLQRCCKTVGYHLHEPSLQSEAGNWCKIKPKWPKVQSELSICTAVCTPQLEAKVCTAILEEKVEMFLHHVRTCLKVFTRLLQHKYFQKLCHNMFTFPSNARALLCFYSPNMKHFTELWSMQCPSTMHYSL